MNKSIWTLAVFAILTSMVYANAVFINGPMKFKPIASAAYEQTTANDPLILNDANYQSRKPKLIGQ